jgi:putative endonuclease
MKQVLGRAGEAMALAFYQADGYDVLAQRFRRGRGELDLVVAREDLVVFAEVKARRGDRCGTASASVTGRKLLRMRLAARAFLLEHAEYRGRVYRFDVVALDFTPDMTACRLEMLRGVV